MYRIFLEIAHATRGGKPYEFSYQDIPMKIFFDPQTNAYQLLAQVFFPLKEAFPVGSKIFLFDRSSYLSVSESKVSFTRTLPHLNQYLFFKKTFSLFLEELKELL